MRTDPGDAATLVVDTTAPEPAALAGLAAGDEHALAAERVASFRTTLASEAAFRRFYDEALPRVVIDPGAVASAWGINPRPALVLLARDGTVSGMHGGLVTRADLERILTAAASGRPIPSVAPAPSPTPTPGGPAGMAFPPTLRV